MGCPACASSDVRRSRRRGWLDYVRSFWGKLPHRCTRCKARFFTAEVQAPSARRSTIAKPQLAIKKHDEKPMAQVIVRANTHQELSRILSKLGREIGTPSELGGVVRPSETHR
jgi:hypothetical protein